MVPLWEWDSDDTLGECKEKLLNTPHCLIVLCTRITHGDIGCRQTYQK